MRAVRTAWLLGLVLATRGPGAAAVHAWASPRATKPAQAHLNAALPAVLAPVPTARGAPAPAVMPVTVTAPAAPPALPTAVPVTVAVAPVAAVAVLAAPVLAAPPTSAPVAAAAASMAAGGPLAAAPVLALLRSGGHGAASSSQDNPLAIARRRAVQESFMEPEPTALGIIDYFGSVRTNKERVKAMTSGSRFAVPWWGWLVLAAALALLASAFFGLGALYSWRLMQAQEAPAGTSGISKAKTTIMSWVKGKSRDSSAEPAGPTNRESRVEAPSSLEEWASRPSAAPPGEVAALSGGCLPCLPQQCGNLFARAVKRAIAALDKKVLGVGMRVGSIHVNARSGTVQVGDLVLENPEGYHSECLLKIEKLELQVSMAKYIFSRGKTVVLESLAIANVDVTYEKALTTSNVDYVLDFARRQKGPNAEDEAADLPTMTGTILGAIATTASSAASAASAAGRKAQALVGDSDEDDDGPEVGYTSTLRQARRSTVGLVCQAKDNLERVTEESTLGRITATTGRAVAGTAGDVVDVAASLAGATLVAGTTIVAGTAEALERQAMGMASGVASGAISGAANVTKRLSDAVGVTSSSAAAVEAIRAEEAARAAEAERQQEASEVAFVVRRLAISNIGVTLASNLVGGRGVRLAGGDITYKDFTSEMQLTGGISIVRFLLKATLLNAVKSLSSIGDFTLETTSRYLELGRSVASEVHGGAMKAMSLT